VPFKAMPQRKPLPPQPAVAAQHPAAALPVFAHAVLDSLSDIVSEGAAGDCLARRLIISLDNWTVHPERRFWVSDAAGTLLGQQPLLRAALCMTCMKRDDQLKQTLPTLCMFMARIRPAASSAPSKHPSCQPQSQQTSQQDTEMSINQHRSKKDSQRIHKSAAQLSSCQRAEPGNNLR